MTSADFVSTYATETLQGHAGFRLGTGLAPTSRRSHRKPRRAGHVVVPGHIPPGFDPSRVASRCIADDEHEPTPRPHRDAFRTRRRHHRRRRHRRLRVADPRVASAVVRGSAHRPRRGACRASRRHRDDGRRGPADDDVTAAVLHPRHDRRADRRDRGRGTRTPARPPDRRAGPACVDRAKRRVRRTHRTAAGRGADHSWRRSCRAAGRAGPSRGDRAHRRRDRLRRPRCDLARRLPSQGRFPAELDGRRAAGGVRGARARAARRRPVQRRAPPRKAVDGRRRRGAQHRAYRRLDAVGDGGRRRHIDVRARPVRVPGCRSRGPRAHAAGAERVPRIRDPRARATGQRRRRAGARRIAERGRHACGAGAVDAEPPAGSGGRPARVRLFRLALSHRQRNGRIRQLRPATGPHDPACRPDAYRTAAEGRPLLPAYAHADPRP